MTVKMLASIKNICEAKIVKRMNIDIIDIKNISEPPMGFAGCDNVEKIKDYLEDSIISVTMGNDLNPYNKKMLYNINSVINNKIDYVKIGFFSKKEIGNHQRLLKAIDFRDTKPICVLFADDAININIIKELSNIGYKGVMLDTMKKDNKSIIEVFPDNTFISFIKTAKHYKMTSGIAGSLKIKDIASIHKMNPNFMGFRGQLCKKTSDRFDLDASQIKRVFREFALASKTI